MYESNWATTNNSPIQIESRGVLIDAEENNVDECQGTI